VAAHRARRGRRRCRGALGRVRPAEQRRPDRGGRGARGSYKQDNPAPRYHARDVAIARARGTGATVLLGSATPAVESFYKAEAGEWGFLPLRERVLFRPLPSVEVVDLRAAYGTKKSAASVFSPTLQEAIADRLNKGEQVILF
jgi:primosomal protein N' (replication factor Y)